MSACGVCGKARRTGSGGRATVIENGTLRSALACAECVGRGIILTTPPANLPTLTKANLDDDERDIRAVLRKLARHLHGLAKSYKAGTRNAALPEDRAEGLDQAAEIADEWASRPEVRR